MKLNINGNIIEIADEDLTKAIEKKESIDVNNDSLVIRTTNSDKTFSDNTRKEGIATGAEIGRKEVLKGFGIEGEGLHRTDTSAIGAIKTHTETLVAKALNEAKIEPDKKVTELQNDIKILQSTISDKDKLIENKTNEFTSFKNVQLISKSLAEEIPDNVFLPKNDILTLMQSKMKLDVNENGVVFGIGANGEPIKDPSTLEILPVKTLSSNFFNENSHLMKKADGGAGGGDSNNNDGKQSIDDFTKEMNDAGHNTNSPKFTEIMNERIKAGTLDI